MELCNQGRLPDRETILGSKDSSYQLPLRECRSCRKAWKCAALMLRKCPEIRQDYK